MKARWLAGCAGMVMAACVAGTASAQTLPPGVTLPGGTATTITLADGTTVKTTITGPTTMIIETSGGPNPPITANITNLVMSGANINYAGTVTVAGSTSSFDCTINTQTNSISGSQYCSSLFGGQGGGTTNPPPTTGGGTVTPPTTGGGTVTTTPGPNGTTLYTMTLPGGASIQVTQPQLNLIRNVEAEQFLLSLAAERLTVNQVQSFVASRLQALQAAGLAPGGINIGSLYRGRAAGETGVASGIWADVAYSDLEDERIGSGVEGDAQSFAVGGDISFGSYNLGAFVAYSTSDLSGLDASVDSDGFSYGAYGRWSATPQFNVSLTVGAADQNVDFERTAGALVSAGKTDRSSTFAILGVDGQFAVTDTFLVVPGVNVSYAETETDAYLDSNGFPIGGVASDTTVATAGATLYYTGGSVLPYLSLNASRQLNDIAGVDRSYGTIGAGVIANITEQVNLLAGVSTLVSKDGENDTTFSLTLRRGF